MKCKVLSEKDHWIWPKDMPDGAVAVIVQWDTGGGENIGRVVQACGSRLIEIGMGQGDSWDDRSEIAGECRVRLLRLPATIEISD